MKYLAEGDISRVIPNLGERRFVDIAYRIVVAARMGGDYGAVGVDHHHLEWICAFSPAGVFLRMVIISLQLLRCAQIRVKREMERGVLPGGELSGGRNLTC